MLPAQKAQRGIPMTIRRSFGLYFVIVMSFGCGARDPSESNDIPTLIEAFKDTSENNMVAARAMYKLVEIGRPAVPKLIEALESNDVQMKLMALNTLGLMGASAADAVPAIKKALQHSDVNVQNRAKDALQKISSP
jgi:HEAT repeat protein